MPLTMSITRKLHATTLVNVAAVGAITASLFLAFRGMHDEYALLNGLRDQRSHAVALEDLASETTLLLERAIYKKDLSDLNRILAKSEDLQFTFSAFRDAAYKHRLLEDETIADEVEPIVYALRNDIVKCAALLRKGRHREAETYFSSDVRRRAEPIRRFVETCLRSKDARIDEATHRLEGIQRILVEVAIGLAVGMVCLVALANARIGRSITRPLASLVQANRRLADGDYTPCSDVPRGDEFGELAASFNAMVAERARAEEELIESNAATVKALERERQVAEELQAAMEQLEAARQDAEGANRAKSEFLANMSHEIRTPMTAILGFADILLEHEGDQDASPERIEAAQTIKKNGEHLIGIINDILDLSKVEAGKMSVERIACNPCRTIAEVASLVKVKADAKGLYFNVEYIGAIPQAIRSDPTRLRQILINLIGNAIKFTVTGGVRLVTRFVEGEGRPVMQFDVLDTGIGMTKEQLAKLFRPFTQADASTTRKFGGTGLGLTISRRFAQLLGGNIILVDTREGVGSCFRLTVTTGPLDNVKMIQDPMAATTIAPGMAASEDESGLQNCRILLAEDGPDNQRLISHVLRKAGAEVTVKENGKLAVEVALVAHDEGHPFDVILMDMQMPVMDGYEATGRLRQKGYDGPIMALTAHAMEGDRQRCLDAGCDDYGSKPVNRKTLIATIRRLLQKRPPAEMAGASSGQVSSGAERSI